MRIAVIGAGIVGITTAWELTEDGHDVTLFERRSSIAEETSFANAGVIAPGYVTPWAAPGMPGKVLAGLLSPHAAVRLGGGIWRCLPWITRYLAACSRPVHEANRRAMQALARYSRTRLDLLANRNGLDYEQARGYLVLLRDESEFARAQVGLRLLQETGTAVRVLDAEACRAVEPGLNPATPLRAGLHLPDDGVGNCRLFAHQLRALAQQAGTRLHFGVEVLPLDPAQPLLLRWRTHRGGSGQRRPDQQVSADGDSGGPRHAADPRAPGRMEPEPGTPCDNARFDAVALCAGVDSARLCQPLGVRLPLQAVFGYSATLPLQHREAAVPPGPRAGLMDERYKVAITRLGQQLRVAGSAELGGRADHMSAAAQRTLYKVLQDWFPGAGDTSRARLWKGGRPMLPDGPPVVGPSPVPGLWLNLGHGSSGWALSCGSARLLADRIAGREPAVDDARLGFARLLHPGVAT